MLLAETASPPDVRKGFALPEVVLCRGYAPEVGAPTALRLIENGLLNSRGIAPRKI